MRPIDIKATAPIDDDTVVGMVLDGEETLLRSIIAQPRSGAATAPPRRRRTPAVRWSLRVAAFGAVCAAVLAGVSLTGRGTLDTAPPTAWATSALRVAATVPRFVLDAPGWEVRYVNAFTMQRGDLSLENGARTIDLMWLPGREYRRRFAVHARHDRRLPAVDVYGRPAALFDNDGSYSAIWRMNGYTFELMSYTPVRRAEFERLVGSLRLVGIDAWLATMPKDAVLPSAQAGTIQELLADLPLPPGFAAPRPGGALSRYQLGAKVAGAVACGWIDQWIAARRARDTTAERAAVAALASSREWPVLREMNATGDYPEAVWGYADAIARGGYDDALSPVEDTYEEALGCNIL